MATLFTVVVALPLALAGPSLPASVPPAVLLSQQVADAPSEAIRRLEDTTKSVVKRRVDLRGVTTYAAEGAPSAGAVSQNLGDPIAQAAFQTAQRQTKGGSPDAPQQGGPANPNAKTTTDSGAGVGDVSSQRATRTDEAPASTAGNSSTATLPPSNLDAATRAAANASAFLLTSALAPPEQNGLDGRGVPLVDALSRASANTQRLEIASLYWKLALAMGDYHWSLDELRQLEALPANAGAVDAPLFATARAAAEAKLAEAKAAAATVQQELADAIGQPTLPLPLVVDQPLVGPYRTHFDTIFGNRTPPGRSRAIDRGLPHWREAIDLRTAAVQAATSAVQAAEAAYGEKIAAAETVLFAHRELHLQRRAFLSAVREYNAEIVEYASYVAGPTTTAATIVSMLTRPKSPVRPAGNSASNGLGPPPEPTLANPRLDPNVRRAAGAEDIGDEQWQADEAQQVDLAPANADASTEPETELKAVDGTPRN